MKLRSLFRGVIGHDFLVLGNGIDSRSDALERIKERSIDAGPIAGADGLDSSPQREVRNGGSRCKANTTILLNETFKEVSKFRHRTSLEGLAQTFEFIGVGA